MGGVPEPPDGSIADVVSAVRAGERSAAELTDAYLARIDAYAQPLNVFRTVTADAARARAAAIDAAVARGEDPGPLAGVPVALKDNIEVAGVPLTASSSFLRDNVATRDAPVVQRLTDAGAVILGKLHMSEWAIGGTTQNAHFGVGHNPWDPERSPGGSSGGSGAAIAADLALATLGTDTGGSIRLPGSLCGCVGLRPSRGRVSNRGSIPVAASFDTIGPLARRAEDVAAVLGAIAGYDRLDPVCEDVAVEDYAGVLSRGVRGRRIGVLAGAFRAAPLEPRTAALLDAAARTLGELGIEVDEDVQLPGHAPMVGLTADLLLAEAAAFHAQRLAENPYGFAPDVLSRLRRGAGVTGPQYGAGRQAQRRWTREVLEALRTRDALLAPACPFPAPRIADSDPLTMTGQLSAFTATFVMTGVPAIVVPIGFVDELPVAMQLIAKPFDEATLLAIAHAFQLTTDVHLRRPSMVEAVAA